MRRGMKMASEGMAWRQRKCGIGVAYEGGEEGVSVAAKAVA